MEKTEDQKGVSLIITFFIMVIILAVVLSVSTLLYSEIKIIRNIGDSVVAFYAADSGVEKVLYYDRKVIPASLSDTICTSDLDCSLNQVCSDGFCATIAVRGLCTMYYPVYSATTNPDVCPDKSNSGFDDSIYCTPNSNYIPPKSGLFDPIYGCDPDKCDDCTISFSTDFDDRNYSVTATISPDPNDERSSALEINSKGSFNNVLRQINIFSAKALPQAIIKIENACANPKTTSQGAGIDISADISTTILDDVISSVSAYIYNLTGTLVATIPSESFSCFDCEANAYIYGHWEYSWSTNTAGAYYVKLKVVDSLGNETTTPNLWPCNTQ